MVFLYYIKDYDTWRPFLQLLSYGCYHKAFVGKKLHLSDRTYDQHWARVRFFLPEDRLHVTRRSHREIHSLQGDSYQASPNYLARTYELHAITGKKAFYFLALLSALQHTKSPLDENTLTNQVLVPIDKPLPDGIGTVSRSSVHRHLKELSDLRLIICTQRNGHAFYTAYSHPLTKLCAGELDELRAAVCAYRTFSRLGASGICSKTPSATFLRPPAALVLLSCSSSTSLLPAFSMTLPRMRSSIASRTTAPALFSIGTSKHRGVPCRKSSLPISIQGVSISKHSHQRTRRASTRSRSATA